MLEFKNAKVALSAGSSSRPFSLVMGSVEVCCLCGPAGSGKSRLLLSVLGLEPLMGGYVTVDGELVTPGSSAYFRQMVAYVPQQVPDVGDRVSDLCDMVLRLRSHPKAAERRNELAAQWQLLGIDAAYASRRVDEVPTATLQLIMLSLAPLLGKPILLVDNPVQNAEVQSFLQGLASVGTEILYTCRENKMQCNQIVNL